MIQFDEHIFSKGLKLPTRNGVTIPRVGKVGLGLCRLFYGENLSLFQPWIESVGNSLLSFASWELICYLPRKLMKPAKLSPRNEKKSHLNLHDFGFHLSFRGCTDSLGFFQIHLKKMFENSLAKTKIPFLLMVFINFLMGYVCWRSDDINGVFVCVSSFWC